MFRGSVWMVLLRWGVRLTGLLSTIILARLLIPSDFGIVAMAMFVVSLLELLAQSGQTLAIIRHHNPTRADYDTAWTLSVAVGLVVAILIWVAAPITAAYFHESRVQPVMQWLSVRSLLAGFENIGITDFRRDLKFNLFFLYNISGKVISFVVAIPLAFMWRSYWALVAGIIVAQLARNVMSFIMHPYRPRLSLAKLSEMGSFSAWTLVKVAGGYFNAQADQIVVGGLLGSGAMGGYAVATDLASSPSKEITEPMVAALYPVMARARSDQGALRRLYIKTFGWSAVICASTALGVLMVAHDLVHLVLGNKWLTVEPLMGWLALSGGLLGLSAGAYTTFDALGKPRLGAQMQWVRLVILVVALVPVSLFLRDMSAIAIARFAVTALFIPTLLLAIGREINISASDYLGALWRPALASACMCTILYFANGELVPGDLRLACDVVMGAVSFVVILLFLWRLAGKPQGPERDFQDAVAGLFSRLKLRFKPARA
jgi:O-antigen/teichoic acid export membrane protein